jgi:hypothetical protein
MQFLSIREFSKAPKTALSKLAHDSKAVLTNNGKPAAIMLTVNTESFEQVYNLVQEVENRLRITRIYPPAENNKECTDAFERLMNFKRKKIPPDFNYKKELMEAIDERFGSVD